MQSDDETISITKRAVMYISAPSYEEYVGRTSPLCRQLLRSRSREIRVSPDDQAFFCDYPESVYVLAVVTDDSPATMAVLPVIAHIADMSTRMDIRVMSDKGDLSSLQNLVGNEEWVQKLPEQELPKFLFFGEDWNHQEQWGPHPQAIEPYLDDWFNRFPLEKQSMGAEGKGAEKLSAELAVQLTYEMRIWYNTWLNDACVKEICALLKGLQEMDALDT
jgi:hypothetical protein